MHDNGIGIAPAQRQAIVDPFVQGRGELTREHEGAGLGPAISRDLARQMGGARGGRRPDRRLKRIGHPRPTTRLSTRRQ